jgi:hypothetical protein
MPILARFALGEYYILLSCSCTRLLRVLQYEIHVTLRTTMVVADCTEPNRTRIFSHFSTVRISIASFRHATQLHHKRRRCTAVIVAMDHTLEASA